MEASEIKALWDKANDKSVSINVKKSIHAFWKYVSENIQDMDLSHLYNVDIEVIKDKSKVYKDWKDYSLLLSQSGVMYMTMTNLCQEIAKSAQTTKVFTFILQTNQFPLKVTHPLLEKEICKNFADAGKQLDENNMTKYEIVFNRFWIVLTSMGDETVFPLIEKTYKISREYNIHDFWQVVKYLPPKYRSDDKNIPPFIIPYGAGNIHPDVLRYEFLEGELTITVDKILSVGELESIRSHCLIFLSNLVGEYNVRKFLKSLGVYSREYILVKFPDIEKNFKPMSEFYKDAFEIIFGETKMCSFCSLRECNSEFVAIDHKLFNMKMEDYLPEGHYCSFCVKSLSRLFIGS